jgi:hypothetical protein
MRVMVTIPMLIFEDREQVMFDRLRYRYHLDRLQREKRQTQRSFQKAWIKAKAEEKSEDDLQVLLAEENHELNFIEDNIHQLLHTYLTSEAEKHFVPVPEFDFRRKRSDESDSGKWERSDVSDRYRLTQDAIRELRSAIRAERKESSELARSWLTGLTGLIGVLIGLLAIILGRR